MNIKKLIREEMDDFEWANDIEVSLSDKEGNPLEIGDYVIVDDEWSGYIEKVYPDWGRTNKGHGYVLVTDQDDNGFRIVTTRVVKD
jgi:hypothetical protein